MHTQLTRWHPFREMEGFFDQYARAMHRAMLRHEERSATAEIADWAPTVDVSESDDAYVVRAELPGVDKDDVHVSLDNGVLTLQGEKKVEVTEGLARKSTASSVPTEASFGPSSYRRMPTRRRSMPPSSMEC